MSTVLAGQNIRAAHNNDLETRTAALETALGLAALAPTFGTSGTTTSSTYADVPGTSSVSFTKVRTASRICLRLAAAFFLTDVAGTTVTFALRINGVDYPVAAHALGTLSINVVTAGFATVGASVVPAGTYTVQARWKRSGGTGTVNRDTGTVISFEVEEKW